MATVTLSDGRKINFSGTPTTQDVEEAVSQLDSQANAAPDTQQAAPQEAPQEDMAQTVAQPPAKRTVEDDFRGMFGESKIGKAGEAILISGIVAPFMETARQFNQGMSTLMGDLDAAIQLGTKAVAPSLGALGNAYTIAKETGVDIPGADYFKNMAKSYKDNADVLPETQLPTPLKFTYGLLGQAGPLSAEFLGAGEVLKGIGVTKYLASKGYSALTPAAEFGLVQALTEYSKDPNMKSFLKGGIEGMEMGMAFPIVGKFIGNAVRLGKYYGKKAMEGYVRVTSGDPVFAKYFMDNWKKFNLSVFSSVKAPIEIKAENDAVIGRFKKKWDVSKEQFDLAQRTKAEELSIKLDNSKSALDNAQKLTKESMNERSSITLKDATDVATKAIVDNNKFISESINETFGSTLTKYQALKKEYGESVGISVKNIMNANPDAKIPARTVKNHINEVIDKYSPFKVVNGEYVQKTAAGIDKNDVEAFKRIMTEIDELGKGKDAGYHLDYLQDLKNDLYDLAQAQSKDSLKAFYSELSRSVNPAEISSKSIAKNYGEVNDAMRQLAKDNAVYSDYMNRYDTALKNYYNKDANGNYIPNIDKAINAVRKHDVELLKQMNKADMALKPEDRILPKVKALVDMSDKFEIQQMNIIGGLKAKAKKDLMEFNKRAEKAVSDLRAENNRLSFDSRNRAIEEVNKFKLQKADEYQALIDKLSKSEEFIKHQYQARAWNAGARYGAYAFQHIGMWSAIGGGSLSRMFGSNPLMPVAGGAATAMLLSPIAATNVAQTAGKVWRVAAKASPGVKLLEEILKSSKTRVAIKAYDNQ